MYLFALLFSERPKTTVDGTYISIISTFQIVDSVIQSDVTLKNATKQFTDALGPLSVYLATTMK